MSNKGLTFLIIILLLLCGATFGAFYLKIHPEIALSQKIFCAKVAEVVDENVALKDAPINENTTPFIVDTVPVVPIVNNEVIVDNNIIVPVKNDDKKEQDIVVVEPVKPIINEPEEIKTPIVLITKILKKGSNGSEVKILQQFLVDNDYLTGKVDGSFGQMTETAVKKFQTEYKITADGVVGGNTMKIINELLAE